METVASLLREEMTGADIYSICSNAWLSALRRTIRDSEIGNNFAFLLKDVPNQKLIFLLFFRFAVVLAEATELDSTSVMANLNDFKAAIKMFKPSINEDDQRYFNKLKENFSR